MQSTDVFKIFLFIVAVFCMGVLFASRNYLKRDCHVHSKRQQNSALEKFYKHFLLWTTPPTIFDIGFLKIITPVLFGHKCVACNQVIRCNICQVFSCGFWAKFFYKKHVFYRTLPMAVFGNESHEQFMTSKQL